MFSADVDTVFKAILAVLTENKEPVALADRERGLINTRSIPVSNRQLREILAKEFLQTLGRQDGRYLLSFRIEKVGNGTRVTITPMIIVNLRIENPLGGRPAASNGTLERRHLEAIARRIP